MRLPKPFDALLSRMCLSLVMSCEFRTYFRTQSWHFIMRICASQACTRNFCTKISRSRYSFSLSSSTFNPFPTSLRCLFLHDKNRHCYRYLCMNEVSSISFAIIAHSWNLMHVANSCSCILKTDQSLFSLARTAGFYFILVQILTIETKLS